MKGLNLLITGVGGQGIILASNIVGEVALASGYDIKKTDTLGMAQRGGSVISHLRMGRRVHSPLIRVGNVDIMLALEKLEAARWSHYLRIGAIAVVNDYALPPPSVSLGSERYPPDSEIIDSLKRRQACIYLVDAIEHARLLGNIRTFNVFLLGCISLFMPFKIDIWKESVKRCVPEKVAELNCTAFDLGRKELRSVGRRSGVVSLDG
jgi:indolepyruvate ferredoxin oxidoreductase beta subunit